MATNTVSLRVLLQPLLTFPSGTPEYYEITIMPLSTDCSFHILLKLTM